MEVRLMLSQDRGTWGISTENNPRTIGKTKGRARCDGKGARPEMRRARCGEWKEVRPALVLHYVTAIAGASAIAAYRTMSSQTYCTSESDRPGHRTKNAGPRKAPHTNGELTNTRCIEEHQYDEDHKDEPAHSHCLGGGPSFFESQTEHICCSASSSTETT